MINWVVPRNNQFSSLCEDEYWFLFMIERRICMCSFMVYTKDDIKKEEFEREFAKIKYRGPDMSRLEEDKGI